MGTERVAVTVSVTGMVLGEPEAPEAETVMVPVYVPAERLPELMETVAVPLFEPDEGETESQVWFPEAPQLMMPPPTFETEKDCELGELPTAAEKLREVAETEREGVEGGVIMPLVFTTTKAPKSLFVWEPIAPGRHPADGLGHLSGGILAGKGIVAFAPGMGSEMVAGPV